MKFEFGLAKKYLLPRRKQLSVSLICLLSVFVITLVVWLLLTFLSVMGGIEKGWLTKLTSLNAPLRINPTERYFNSYYHRIDSIASASNYSLKTLGEKLRTETSDPYQPDVDMEIPLEWQLPEKTADGKVIDLVKEAYQAAQGLGDVITQDYAMSGAMLRIKLVRGDYHSFVTQASYLTTFADQSPAVKKQIEEGFSDLSPNAHGEPGVLIPKSFKSNGVEIGDRGQLEFGNSSTGSQQRIGVHVAGFYDPGIMAIGPKCILVPHDLAETLHSAGEAYTLDRKQACGFQIWFDDLEKTDQMKASLQSAIAEKGLSPYFTVSSYRDYDFAKDLLQQFESDKLLFTLIGVIILVVAASNIISALILLVHNKRKEIGILQSMGATKKSIALTFAFCGMTIGLVSSLVGGLAAYLTLHNIDDVVRFLSWIQGHDMFNTLFYGASLPNSLSTDAVKFIIISTPLISLLAGLIPAIKASRMQPSEILRSS